MSTDTVIPKRINNYIRRLLIEYRKESNTDLLNILTKGELKIESHYEKFDSHYHYYYTIRFLLPEECFEDNISLSDEEKEQEKLCNRLKNDLNRIIKIPNESIREIIFDLKEDSKEINFDSYLKNKIKVDPKNITLWEPDCLRAFISHSVKDYEIANILKNRFINFGISCFVAHKDIPPTKEWKETIKEHLKSMEVMLLLVTGDSCKSSWVDQESGFAWGQNIPIIPVKLDQHDPKGFISGIQAMTLNKELIINRQGQHDTIKKLVDCIKNKLPEHPVWKKNLIAKFLDARNYRQAKETFMSLIDLKFEDQEIEKIVSGITDKTKGSDDFGGLNQLRVILIDGIDPKHLKKIPNEKYEFYAELLRDKILSQHTKKRYSIIKFPEIERGNLFKIIDDHQTMNNQNLDVNNSEELPF